MGDRHIIALAVGVLAVVVVGPLLYYDALRDPKLEPYETKGGSPSRLDGEDAPVDALAISEARRLDPRRPVYVRGYLLAPYDDSKRLCTRLEKSGLCPEPSLVLDTSAVDLHSSPALESGCCSLGLWSPRPLVLRLDFRGPTVRVVE